MFNTRSAKFEVDRESLTRYEKLLEERDRKRSLQSEHHPISVVGICEDMCPEFERYERELHLDLSPFEVDQAASSNSKYPRIDHKKAVKKYRRPAAGNEEPLSEDIRPPPILVKTLYYLLTEVLDKAGTNHALLMEAQKFVRDRTRSIRQDLSIQNANCLDAIQIHEQLARFHIVIEFLIQYTRFYATSLADQNDLLPPWEKVDPSDYDSFQNKEQLRKILISLEQLYENADNFESENFGEIYSYKILANLESIDSFSFIFQTKNGEIMLQKYPEIQNAMEIALAFWSGNIVRFMHLIEREENFFISALSYQYAHIIRIKALKFLSEESHGHELNLKTISNLLCIKKSIYGNDIDISLKFINATGFIYTKNTVSRLNKSSCTHEELFLPNESIEIMIRNRPLSSIILNGFKNLKANNFLILKSEPILPNLDSENCLNEFAYLVCDFLISNFSLLISDFFIKTHLEEFFLNAKNDLFNTSYSIADDIIHTITSQFLEKMCLSWYTEYAYIQRQQIISEHLSSQSLMIFDQIVSWLIQKMFFSLIETELSCYFSHIISNWYTRNLILKTFKKWCFLVITLSKTFKIMKSFHLHSIIFSIFNAGLKSFNVSYLMRSSQVKSLSDQTSKHKYLFQNLIPLYQQEPRLNLFCHTFVITTFPKITLNVYLCLFDDFNAKKFFIWPKPDLLFNFLRENPSRISKPINTTEMHCLSFDKLPSTMDIIAFIKKSTNIANYNRDSIVLFNPFTYWIPESFQIKFNVYLAMRIIEASIFLLTPSHPPWLDLSCQETGEILQVLEELQKLLDKHSKLRFEEFFGLFNAFNYISCSALKLSLTSRMFNLNLPPINCNFCCFSNTET